MASRICFGIAALFFFFAAVGVRILPDPTAWGLFATAVGLAVGGMPPWKRAA